VLNSLGQLDRTVVRVIMTHKTADEPDHNRRSRRLGTGRHCGVRYRESR
jgi:hypothetical protein